MRLLFKLTKIFILIFSANAFANENLAEGTTSISGTISYNKFQPDSGPKSRQIRIAPKYLYFVNNHIGIGAILGYDNNKFDGVKFEGYAVGPLIRYYIQTDDLLPYISLEYVHSRLDVSGANAVTGKDTTKAASIGLGLNYFFATNVALETELKYSSFNSKSVFGEGNLQGINDSDSSSTDLNIGINVFF